MTERKTRKTKEEKKLWRAIDTLASIIETKAASMMDCIENNSDAVEIKQIKELTGAVKELSLLICQSNGETNNGTYTVLFEGEGEEWAK